MAEHLNGKRFSLCALLLPLCAVQAAAEELIDPTRPPSVGAPARTADASAAIEPALQSVFISANHREAIIDGRSVKTGERIGNAQVVQIQEDRVVLRDKKGLHTLTLFPGIEKRATSGREEFAASRNNNYTGHLQ